MPGSPVVAIGNIPTVNIASSAALTIYSDRSGVNVWEAADIGATLTGPGTLNKTGSGWLGFGLSGGVGATMALTGQVNVLNGELGTDNLTGNWTNNTAGLYLAPNTAFDLRGWSAQWGALTGSGSVVNSYTHGTDVLTVGAGGGSGTFYGTIADNSSGLNFTGSGTVNLTKTGTGTQVLSGNNTYSGATIVNNGVLAVTGSLNGAGSVAVQGGALAGTGNVGTVEVYNGAALAPGYAVGAGTLTAANLTLDSGSALDYTLVAPASAGNSYLAVSGTLTASGATVNIGGALAGGTYSLIGYGYFSGTPSNVFTIGTVSPSASNDTFSFISAPGDLVDLVVAPPLTNGVWNVSASGTWSAAGNWTAAGVPGLNPEDTAVFGTALTSGTAIVTLDSSRSLASLGFSTTGGASYVISASNGSTLTMSNTGGTATISDSGGNHTIAAPITLGSSLSVTATPGSTLTISGALAESNPGTTVSVGGGGTLILSGSTTYTGVTTVNASTLQIGGNGENDGEALASQSIVMSNSATVAFNHTAPLSYGGTISGAGQLIKSGTGNLDLSGTSTYSGPTTISAGTVELDGGGNNLPTATALSIASGGVLDLAGLQQTVGSLSGSAGAIVTNSYTGTTSAVPTLTVNPASGATTFAGNIIGGDALTLSGSGELTLSGSNTYTGGTTVSGGTLDIAAPSALAGSGLVMIAAGGRLVLGSGAGIGALLAASSPASSGAVALSAASAPATIGGYENTSGSMATLGGVPHCRKAVGGSAVGSSPAAVPEPGTIALLAAGAVAVAAVRRKRKGC